MVMLIQYRWHGTMRMVITNDDEEEVLMARNKCMIDNCKNDVRYIHLRVCAACYGGLTTWRGRSVRDKRYRLEQIDRLQSRMEFMIDNPRHAPKHKRKV